MKFVHKSYGVGTSSGGYSLSLGTNDGKKWIFSADGDETTYSSFDKASKVFENAVKDARDSVRSGLYGPEGRVSGGVEMSLDEIARESSKQKKSAKPASAKPTSAPVSRGVGSTSTSGT